MREKDRVNEFSIDCIGPRLTLPPRELVTWTSKKKSWLPHQSKLILECRVLDLRAVKRVWDGYAGRCRHLPPPSHMYILGVGIEEMRLSVDLTGLQIQVCT